MLFLEIYDFLGYALKLGMSIFCASLIGWEREKHEKAAGLKTHILICLGACVYTIIGFKVSPEGDLLRVLQGIVTGVGFVGAGAIIREGSNVKGVTTAACIWVISSVGVVIGLGEYVLALVSTITIYFVMNYGRRLGKIKKRTQKKTN